ncbi:MAG TPA: type II toxin-antitoxin system mRNA interferase toxin, RelE/StbE family [Patescibacteria group bacterium]|jgi:addiction module RelE/StbE family toxin|nr:type II toxin-antitoxin system mRNA interferase toxin, RelE/StbE family [Patescibacteria group bacterium]
MKKITRINFSTPFDKQLKKSPLEIKITFRKRLEIFIKDSANPQLHDHQLLGRLKNYRSINITGDWRAIYLLSKENAEITAIFVAIGTHNQLYR